tara:strand:- start:351 stop:668 length:318 start_codon:yes stop_codon:yes gene_type:complete
MQIHTHQNIWDISGSLTFIDTPVVEKKSIALRKKIDSTPPWVINCDALEKIDSAGLAWFLENIAYAKRQQVTLSIRGFNLEKARLLAKAQGVLALLPLEEGFPTL